MEFFDYPVKNQQFLPNFHFILPKFHSILPKFYFAPRWRNFVSSVEISDFLGRDLGERLEESPLVALVFLVPLVLLEINL